MSKSLPSIFSSLAMFVKKHRFALFAIVSFVAIASYYMGPSITQCSTTLYGFGDNTAGPIWRNSVSGESPLWGFTKASNYPAGENLYSPVHLSAVLQYSTYWIFFKAFGAICGMNLVNLLGFVSAAVLMFFCVRWLTKSNWISWFAGFAVAFSPYYQFKVGGHPSFGYQAILIAILWLLMLVTTRVKRRDAVLLALFFAIAVYWDPYFTLLASVLIAAYSLGWLLFILARRKKSGIPKSKLINLVLAGALAFVFILPLGLVKVTKSAEISSFVSGSRGDVMFDARTCSNLPWDYLLPSDGNYVLNKIVGAQTAGKLTKLHHGCNPAEYTVGISLAVLLIAFIGATVLLWEKLNRRRIFKTGQNLAPIFAGVSSLLIGAFLIGLPPNIGGLKLPSSILLELTSTWRILSRFYILVNIALVILVAIILHFIAQKKIFSKKTSTALFVLIVLSVFIQNQAFKPFSGSQATFNYAKDLPSVNLFLRDQTAIQSIAGYPLDKMGESGAISIFLTAQTINKKNLLNSANPNSDLESVRFSIKDFTDPQTLSVLRGLDIDAVLILGLTPNDIANVSGLDVLKYEYFKDSLTGGNYIVARILPGPIANEVIVLEKGFPLNGEIMKNPVEIQYESTTGSIVKRKALPNKTAPEFGKICFDIKPASKLESDSITVLGPNGEVVLANLPISGVFTRVIFTAKLNDNYTIKSTSGHNTRINNLGCSSGE